jgi:heme A synthase
MHYLLPIFKFFDQSALGHWVADSRWLFPAIEAVHIVALCVMFGAILVLNLRLLGLAFNNKPVAKLAQDFAPWVLVNLIIILATGVLLFSSEALKAYASVPFQVKMLFLFAAMIYHYTVFTRVTRTDDARTNHVLAKVVAIISIVLWLGVGIGGRGIGFL